jgi:aminodeoxyfutalosine deaminase
LVIVDERIEFIGKELPQRYSPLQPFRITGSAILPGLINSHCHLEFSDFDSPIPAGKSFAEWIRKVVEHRSQQRAAPEHLLEQRAEAVRRGVAESYASGVRWIIDMMTDPWDGIWVEQAVRQSVHDIPTVARFATTSPLVVQSCSEVIDINTSRRSQSIANFHKHKDAPKSSSAGRLGIAPHASYTASRPMTHWASEVSRSEQRLLSMHLAESSDEMEWLHHAGGAFKSLLSLFISEPDWYFQALGGVTDRLMEISQAFRAIVAHCNYLESADLDLLAENCESMAIVHCPRTFQHFGHLIDGQHFYPIADRLNRGVRHLLGTDSRASNPDLNLWCEAQQIHALHSDVSSHKVLEMITLEPASFLGLNADDYGAIRVGCRANLTAVKLSASETSDENALYDLLLHPSTISKPLEFELELVANSHRS